MSQRTATAETVGCVKSSQTHHEPCRIAVRLRRFDAPYLLSLSLTVFLLSSLAPHAIAQGSLVPKSAPQPPQMEASRFGFEGFRMLLQDRGLRPVTSVAQFNKLRPSKTAMVLLGDPGPDEINEILLPYLNDGGRIFLASDKGPQARLSRWDVKLRRGPVTVRDGRSRLAGHVDCPLVTHLRAPIWLPVFEGVQVLATNRPGYIREHGSLLPVAWLPDELLENGKPIQRQALMAVWPSPNGGHLVVAADHSILINEMLLQKDNAVFAENLTKWLSEGGYRTSLLFVVDGVPQDVLEAKIPLEIPPELPDIPPEALIPFINTVSAGMEDENLFNRIIAALSEEMDLTVIVVMVTVTLLAFGSLWLIAERARPPARRELNNPADVQTRRQDELVRSDNLGRTAQHLAAQFFQTLEKNGVSSRAASTHRAAVGAGVPNVRPRVVMQQGPWRQSREIDSKVARLWRIAKNSSTRRVTAQRLQSIVDDIETLRQKLEVGQVSIEW